MRKVVLYTLTSVDGTVEDPSRYFPEFDTLLRELEARLISTQDAVLLGRNMYEDWTGYWPKIDHHPFAEFINNVKMYVVTSRPLTSSWGDVEAVTGPVNEFVRHLKARPGGAIGVHGSIQLAQSLLAADLIDELHLAVGPVLDPTGRQLFQRHNTPGLPARRFDLLGATSTPGGGVWLSYRLP